MQYIIGEINIHRTDEPGVEGKMRKFVAFVLIILIAVEMTVGAAGAASIIGYKFYDYNRNGVKDGNGVFLPGWEITVENETWSDTQYTGPDGHYNFTTGLYNKSSYNVTETLNATFRNMGWYNTSNATYEVHFYKGSPGDPSPYEHISSEEELEARMDNLPTTQSYVWLGYNIRIGDINGNKDPELKMFEPLGDWNPGASSKDVSPSDHTTWTSGTYKHFNLTWTNTTMDPDSADDNANMTIDLDGVTQDDRPSADRANAWPIRHIVIRLHSEDPNYYVEIDNVVLKQGLLTYELESTKSSPLSWSESPDTTDYYLVLRASAALEDLGGDQISEGFSLDGDIRFTWTGSPKQNDIKMDVLVGRYLSSYDDVQIAIFGNHINGTVSGYKLDTLGNGLEGWNITCTNTTLEFYGYNVTNDTGYYEIHNVPPGYFELNESLGDWPEWAPIDGNRTIHTTLEQLNLTDENFVNTLNGSVSGFKINDLNVNGRWDPGEPTLSGWTITLSNQTVGYTNSSVTNATGQYLIENVPMGIYWLNETLESGWTQVTLNRTVQVTEEELVLTNQNFTNAQSFRNITGYKFNDLNRNGIWDTGEPPIENWQVCVNYTNGTPLACDLTNESGYYEFADLSSFETYRVTEDLYSSWVNSTNRTVNLSFICPDFPILPPPQTPGSTVTLNYTSGGTPIPAPPLPAVDYAYFRATADIASGYDIINQSQYPAWCVDANTLVGPNEEYGTCCFISSYDEANISLLGAYPNVATTDWDMVNYVLNRRHDPGVNYNSNVVQRTLWNLTNGMQINTSSFGGFSLSSGEVTSASTLRSEAIANGTGYIPPCGGVMGVFVNLSATGPLKQLTMMELPTQCCDTGYDFGNYQLNGSVSGYKVNETSVGQPGWAIILSNETAGYSETNVTNSSGYFIFENVPFNTYWLNETLQSGWIQVTENRTVEINATVPDLTDQLIINRQEAVVGNISGYKLNETSVGQPGWAIILSNETAGYSETNVTNSSGYFTFENVPFNTYWLNETLQSGWIQVTENRTVEINATVPDLSDLLIINRQEAVVGNISGYKLNETSVGQPGWAIILSNETAGYSETNVTNSSGYFTFENVPFNTYWLNETLQSGWVQVTENRTVEINATVPDLTDQLIINRQEAVVGNISGYKVNETSVGQPGWAIILSNETAGYSETNVTNSSGYFTFENVPFNTYWLNETLQSGWVQVTENRTVEINATVPDLSDLLIINRQEALVGYISGYKVNSGTGDGIEGWTITLYNETADVLVSSQGTGTGGFYNFTGLAYDQVYNVSESIEAGWIPVGPITIPGLELNTTNPSYTEQNFTNEQQSGSVSGFKLDGDGTGLEDWTIHLYNETNGNLVNTTTTGAGGYYIFENVADWGYYNITEDQQPGYQVITPASGWHSHIYINGMPVTTPYNFTNEQEEQVGYISGYKIWEETGNGLSGWTINLYNQTSGDFIRSTSTDTDGFYNFTNLKYDVTYKVSEVMKPHWNSVGSTFIENLIINDQNPFYVDQNFNNNPYPYGTVSGYKRSQGDNLGLEGWTISLYNSATGNLYASRATNANGRYEFLDVPFGSYQLKETPQSGWKQISPDISFDLDIDNYEVTYNFINSKLRCCQCPTVAHFSWKQTVPGTIQFIDESTGNPVQYYWKFGDGATSTDPNPKHAYQKAGTYTVNQYVKGANCAGTVEATWASYTKEIQVQAATGPAVYNSALVSETIPATMTAGQSQYVSITVKNTGTLPWSENDLVRLGYVDTQVGYTGVFGSERLNIPSGTIIEPGESYTFTFAMVAPGTSGTYTPQYRMLKENVEWFGETLSHPIVVTGTGATPGQNDNVDFLDDWTYRKTVAISGSPDGALTDYQIQFTVHRSDGTDSGEDVYLGTDCNDDYSDLRFTTADNTQIPYWIESADASSATVWVKVPSIPTTGTQVYLYYGNPDAEPVSNGDATFVFFDDFDGSSLDASKWVSTDGVYLSGGICSLSSSGSANYFQTIPDFGIGHAARFRWMTATEQNYLAHGFYQSSANRAQVYYYHGLKYITAKDGTSTIPSHSNSFTSFAPWEIQRGSTSLIQFVYNDETSTAVTTNVPTVDLPITFRQVAASGTTSSDFDWMLVRKHSPTEPAVAGWTAKEQCSRSPSAEFTATNIIGDSPLTVQFTDLSLYQPTTWHWDFGDGSTSALQNPTHTYSDVGSYTVSLTAGNDIGSDTITKENYITVTEPPAFLDSWSYRKLVTVTGSPDGDLTDYQVQVTVHRSDGTDSGKDVYLGTDCNDDYSDLRFTTADNTLLSYWIESADANSATVWVKVPSIPTTGTQVYLYYGNTDADPVSNGDATFVFFDDFDGSSLDASKWVSTDGVYLSGGICSLSSSGSANYFQTIPDFGIGHAARFRWMTATEQNYLAHGFYQSSANRAQVYYYHGLKYITAKDGTSSISSHSNSYTSFAPWEIQRGSTSLVRYVYNDGPSTAVTTNVPTVDLPITFRQVAASGTTSSDFDWMLVRKHSPTEPAVAGWTAKEQCSRSPSAEFTATNIIGDSPLTVQFTDLSLYQPTTWHWDFGDGSTSALQNPTHTYSDVGSYTVSLTAGNDIGSDTITKTDYVNVTAPPAFLDQWMYRKLVTVTGSPDGDLTDYQVQFTVHRSDGTDNGEDVYLGTDCNDDYSDLRFAATDNTPMSYWIESADATSATFWVKVPSIPTTGTQVYLYYGNIDAEPVSNGDATFVFFDDFTGSSLDASKWVSTDGVFLSGGICSLSSSGSANYFQTIPDFGIGHAARFRWMTATEQNYLAHGFYQSSANRAQVYYYHGLKYITTKDGTSTIPSHSNSFTSFAPWEIQRGSTSLVRYVYNDETSTAVTTNVPTVDLPITFRQVAASGTTSSDFDWMLVRKHSPTEPAVAGWTAKEQSSRSPSAEFTAENTEGNAPLIVEFTDLSTGFPTTWEWEFGDGNTSDLQKPTHTYEEIGTYTVSLTAGNAIGSDTITKAKYINVTVISAVINTQNTSISFPIEEPPGILNASVVSHTISPTMTAGQNYNVTVTMENTGTLPWSENELVRLGGVENNASFAAIFGPERLIILPEITVEPGESYTFTFGMTAPETPGSYTPEYRMLKEDVEWFGETLSQPIEVTSEVEETPGILNASIVSHTIPSTMTAGQNYNVTVSMENTGTLPWSENELIRLGGVENNASFAAIFGPERLMISSGITVEPEESYTFTFEMTAPETPGSYTPEYRMLKENVECFGETLSHSIEVTSAVEETPGILNASVFSHTIPSTMTAGQNYNVTVSMENTGTLPWSENELIRLGGVENNASVAAVFGPERLIILPEITVETAESYTFTFEMSAPETPGSYTPEYRMLKEDVEWFGETLSHPIEVMDNS